jgi:hypothetical protein
MAELLQLPTPLATKRCSRTSVIGLTLENG